MSTPPRRPFRRPLALLACALAATLAAARGAAAAPPASSVPLAAWERDVEDEIAKQDVIFAQAKATNTQQAVVSRFENRVGRDPSALNEFLLGRAQFYADNKTAAKAAMERALAARPDFYFARLRLAVLFAELRSYDEARAQLRLVLTQKPGLRAALELLARCAVGTKDWDGAVRALGEILSADPSDLAARKNLAFVHMERKAWADAEREITILTTRDPNDLTFRFMSASVCLETGREDRAAALLESIVREQPGSFEALRALVRLYERRQDWPRLRSTLERMLPYVDDDARRKIQADIETLKKGPPPAAAPERRAPTLAELVQMVDDPDPNRRENALIALYDGCLSGEVKQIPSAVLRRITSDVEPSDAARSFAVKILGTLAPEQVLPLLSVVLYDESERVRMLAAEAIGGTGRAVGLAYLFPLLSSESMSVYEYQALRTALGRITGFSDLPPGATSVKTAEDVAASREAWRRWRLSDASDEVKRAAIRQLVEFREQAAERFLYDFVLDPSFDVMSEAYKAMREAVRRAPRDPVEKKVFPAFPSVPDAEVTRASMRSLQDRVATWMASWVAERRAWLRLREAAPPK